MNRFGDFMLWLLWMTIVLSIIMIPLVIFGIVLNMSESVEKSHMCEQKGGVPIKDRGVYQHCAKPDSYIILESK